MTEEEKKSYMQRYMARWHRWLAELSWSKGAMTTWKPVLTDQQKRDQDEYIKLHNCPF